MRNAAAEAWELVEDGIISEADFRDFVFVNPVRLKTDLNPEFFRGTVVESQVDGCWPSRAPEWCITLKFSFPEDSSGAEIPLRFALPPLTKGD